MDPDSCLIFLKKVQHHFFKLVFPSISWDNVQFCEMFVSPKFCILHYVYQSYFLTSPHLFLGLVFVTFHSILFWLICRSPLFGYLFQCGHLGHRLCFFTSDFLSCLGGSYVCSLSLNQWPLNLSSAHIPLLIARLAQQAACCILSSASLRWIFRGEHYFIVSGCYRNIE